MLQVKKKRLREPGNLSMSYTYKYDPKKPVYTYRLVAHGTLEEKIYKQQFKKEGLAARVVDRQQVLRSMSKEEISYLFDFGDDENLDVLLGMIDKDNCKRPMDSLNLNSSDCPRSCSSDKLMEKLLNRHRLSLCLVLPFN